MIVILLFHKRGFHLCCHGALLSGVIAPNDSILDRKE
jgi:hypothetical protein